jgi:DNA primase
MPASVALPYMGKNMAYLENRNINKEIAAFFHLRFCLKGWFKYILDGQPAYMNFSNRIIIPIFDINGTLVSFQGRDITGTAERKYLFPPGYSATGSYLFNAHNFSGHDTAVVGEGVFDVFALKIALDADSNMRNMCPLGTFGKSVSAEQLIVFEQLKAKGLKRVVMMWDSEIQAIDDAIKYGATIKALGIDVSIAMLPPGKDPNEVPGSVVREAVWRALPLNMQNAVALRMKARKNAEKKQLLPNDIQ